MKPFDLQEALNGAPVKLRNGQKAYVIGLSKVGTEDGNSYRQGASSRGLFLRIYSIYSEARATSPGGRPTAMLSGMLYELVDEDWEEDKHPEAEEVKEQQSSSSLLAKS